MEHQKYEGYKPWKMPWQGKYIALAAVVFFELVRAGMILYHKDSNSVPENTLEEKTQVISVEDPNNTKPATYSLK